MQTPAAASRRSDDANGGVLKPMTAGMSACVRVYVCMDGTVALSALIHSFEEAAGTRPCVCACVC